MSKMADVRVFESACVAVHAIVAACMLTACEPDLSNETRIVSTESIDSTGVFDANRTAHPSPGVYSLQLASTIEVRGGDSLADFMLQGELRLSPQKRASNVWRAQFVGKFQKFEGAAMGGGPEQFEDDLGQPWIFEVDADGRVTELAVAPTVSSVVRQIWKSVAFGSQLVTRPGKEWEGDEPDANGICIARYAVEGQRVTKTKQAYRQVNVRNAPVPVEYEIGSSETEFLFTGNELTDLNFMETLRVTGVEGLPDFYSTTKLTISRRSSDVPTIVSPEGSHQGEALVSALDQTHDSAGEQIRLARLQGLSWEAALTALRESSAVLKPDQDEQERAGRSYVALVAHVEQSAERVNLLAELVLQGDALAETFVAALRDAGTPAAQRALASLSKNPILAKGPRMSAIRALSHVKAPTPETFHTLRDLENHPVFGRQATYGVGSNIHRLLRTDSGLADAGVQHLIDELITANSAPERAKFLVALGNSGHPRVLAQAASAMQHPSIRVRAAAAQAVRRVDAAKADEMLAAALRDPDVEVRRSALDAISEREPVPATVAGLTHVLEVEGEQGVRGLALVLAARWLQNAPELAKGIARIAESDENATFRARARRALDQLNE